MGLDQPGGLALGLRGDGGLTGLVALRLVAAQRRGGPGVEADKAQAAAKAVFGGSGEGVPTVEITAEDGADILSLLVKSGLCASKSDARRNVQQGGVAANDEKVTDIAKTFTDAELKAGVVLKRGKKNFRKVLLK